MIWALIVIVWMLANIAAWFWLAPFVDAWLKHWRDGIGL